MELTVNQMRVRLGKVVEIMATESFRKIYEITASFNDGTDAAQLFNLLIDQCDAYISVVSQHLDDPSMLDEMNLFVIPDVIFTVWMRYHCLTQEFIADDQERKMIVPDDDGALLRYALIDLCKEPA